MIRVPFMELPDRQARQAEHVNDSYLAELNARVNMGLVVLALGMGFVVVLIFRAIEQMEGKI